jgi:hypothetical protein
VFAMASNAVIKNGPAASELSLPMRNTASWVRGPSGARTEYKDVARCFVHQPAAPLERRHPRQRPKSAVVLEALKDEPLRVGVCAPILDRFCARRPLLDVVGRGEETGCLRSNKETEVQENG